jgi:hypothetical protein
MIVTKYLGLLDDLLGFLCECSGVVQTVETTSTTRDLNISQLFTEVEVNRDIIVSLVLRQLSVGIRPYFGTGLLID